ncbi:MAG: alpha-ribazole transporter [Peptococcaceae bacterium BICA1-7]|nr:MAG: alpha-ribazole transporter [Peptococcaceae bacterium BICA1-7]HBV98044.1 alpha-ribazole transporter [Desulfotomaculum sp.]
MSKVSLEQGDLRKSALSVKRIAIMAVFIALSAVGALIKIPSPVGTIGLDSAPGYFSAIAFGSVEGAVIIALGHMMTAAVTGFPLTIPIHIFISVQMALWALVFRWVNRKLGLIAAVIAGIVLNGVVSSFTMMLMGGLGAVLGVMPFLVVGSAINVITAAVAYRIIKAGKLI